MSANKKLLAGLAAGAMVYLGVGFGLANHEDHHPGSLSPRISGSSCSATAGCSGGGAFDYGN